MSGLGFLRSYKFKVTFESGLDLGLSKITSTSEGLIFERALMWDEPCLAHVIRDSSCVITVGEDKDVKKFRVCWSFVKPMPLDLDACSLEMARDRVLLSPVTYQEIK